MVKRWAIKYLDEKDYTEYAVCRKGCVKSFLTKQLYKHDQPNKLVLVEIKEVKQ